MVQKKAVFLINFSFEERILKRTKYLSKLNIKSSVICWDRSKGTGNFPKDIKVKKLDITDSDILFIRLIKTFKLFFLTLLEIIKEKPNLLYIDGLEMLIVGCAYKLLNQNTKIIYEVADLPGGRFKKNTFAKLLIGLSEKVLDKVDLLVLTSPFYWEEYFKDKYPYKNKVIILENLPDKEVFKNFKPQKHKKLTIGFVGFVRYPKQLINLFEACKNLDNVQIIVAGNGEGQDYKYITKESKKYSNILFSGAFDYKKEISAIYSKIDLIYAVYNTSLFNVKVAIPNKLYESILCSIPIIVAKNTRLAELVKKYGVGFEVSDKTPEDVKKLILSILKNRDMLKVCRKNAKKIKETLYLKDPEKKFLDKF